MLKRPPIQTKKAAVRLSTYLKGINYSDNGLCTVYNKVKIYLSECVSYSQQLPLSVQVFPQTRQYLSISQPKKIGLGMKASREATKQPIPRPKLFSSDGMQRRLMRKFVDLLDAPTSLRKHMTARKIRNCLEQSTGQAPSTTYCSCKRAKMINVLHVGHLAYLGDVC